MDEQTTTPAIPLPPNWMESAAADVPCTLIEALTVKLTDAKERLHDAESTVAALESEIANIPHWAKDMTAIELQSTVERWFA